jgi:hypothetical protein
MRSILLLVVLLLARPALADDAIRAEIEGVLHQMAQAVLAGDREGYLEHVATGDPWFAMEQRHWADQLEKYRPAVFTLSIGDGGEGAAPLFTANRAEFPIMMAWRIDTGPKTSWGAGGEERWVRFPTVIFRKINGRWQFCGEKWEYKRGPNFIVRYLPGSEAVADDVVAVFPTSKKHVDAFFGIENTKPQIIQLYQSMDHLKATVYLCMPDHNLGGWNEPGESIKFMDSYIKGHEGWTYAFAHEYGHAATWELGDQAVDLPWWVSEGLAERAAQNFAQRRWVLTDRNIRRLAREDKLPKFEQLADYLTCEPPLKRLAYSQGHHMIAYIDTHWGDEGRNRWATLLAQGQSLDAATSAVMGIDFGELDARWRKSLLEGSVPESEPDPALMEVKPASRPGDQSRSLFKAEDPEALAAELHSLLRQMEAAVSTADIEAYMALVDDSDACFATEQAAWAKDLLRQPPERFTMTLEDEPKIRADGSAVVKVRSTWRMPGDSERFVALPTRFIRRGDGAGSAWSYAGEDWVVVEGDMVRVFYLGSGLDQVAKRVMEVMPEVREHVTEGFELEGKAEFTQRVQEVKLYPTMKHLQHSIYLSYTEPLGGWNEPGESIKLLAQAGTSARHLRVVLAHELGHVCSFELGPKANDAPWWVLEGVAELAAERFSGGFRLTDRMVRRWHDTGNLIEWHRLSDFHGEAISHMRHVYSQGHHMLAFITDRYGRTQRNQWLTAMANGASLDDATREVLGLSFEQLDRDWVSSLQTAAEGQGRSPVEEPVKKE